MGFKNYKKLTEILTLNSQRAAMELISNVGFGVEMSSFEGDTCSAVNMVQHLFEGMYWSQFDPTFMV